LTLFDPEIWKKVPQIRTVPVGEAVEPNLRCWPTRGPRAGAGSGPLFGGALHLPPGKGLVGEGCDKPLETCMSFGMAADFYIRNGLGRAIGKEEALGILKQAETAGLVLSPGNAKTPLHLCLLRLLLWRAQECQALSEAGQPGVECICGAGESGYLRGCGTCTDRCQMAAVWLDDGKVVLDTDRCIGCGLCVSTCSTGVAQPEAQTGSRSALCAKGHRRHVHQARAGPGKMTLPGMAGMMVKSKVDRLLSPEVGGGSQNAKGRRSEQPASPS